MQARGALEGVEFEVLLPKTGGRPFARESQGRDSAPIGLILTPQLSILLMLDSLKRSFWPWEWPITAKSGFLPAAEAAVGALNSQLPSASLPRDALPVFLYDKRSKWQLQPMTQF